MRFQFPQLLILFIIGSSNGITSIIDLECIFEIRDFATVGRQYTCVVQNDLNIIEPNVTISFASGTHASNETSNSVTALWIENKNTEYLASNIGEIFPNLIALRVKDGRLKELHKDDLMSMPKLKYLNLDNNDVAVLDDDVFEYNPQLELLWLSLNKIIKIGENLADGFKKLVSLDLTKNVCVSKRFSKLQSVHVIPSDKHLNSVYHTLTEIMHNCSNFKDIIFETNLRTENQDHPDVNIYENQIKNLNIQLFSTKSELRSIKLKLVEEMSSKSKTLDKLHELQANQTLMTNEVDIDKSQNSIMELQIKLKQEEKEVKNLKDELKKLKDIHNELSNVKILLKKYEDEMYKLEEQRQRDQTQIRQLQTENALLRNKVKELQKSVPKVDTGNSMDENIDSTEATVKVTANAETNDIAYKDLDLTTQSTNDTLLDVRTDGRLDLRGLFDDDDIVEDVTVFDYYN